MSDNFQFKQFNIKQEKSAMKIGTDSVLLGSFTEIDNAKYILDIGTGTGILAIMMAQKSSAKIDAVEIDELAYEEATENAQKTKWANQLKIYHTAIQDFSSPVKYDLIISNPPFYASGKNVEINDSQRGKARHDKDLPFKSLCVEVENRLAVNGNFWLILPVNEAEEFMVVASKHGFFMQREIFIKPKPSKATNRIVMCLAKQKAKLYSEIFTLYDESGRSSEEHYELTRDFLLWKQR